MSDMFKDFSMRIFLVHVTAFVAGVIICAAINLWLTPGTLWFPWALMGWGVAVAVHAFALLLRKTRRRERIFIDPKARASIVHLFAYVAVVLLLAFVNFTVTPKVWWSYWVALGWGIGVAFHLWHSAKGADAHLRRHLRRSNLRNGSRRKPNRLSRSHHADARRASGSRKPDSASNVRNQRV
jgi:hypothetical protein